MIAAWRMVSALVLVAGSMGWTSTVDAQSAAGRQAAAKKSEAAGDKGAGATKLDAAAAQKLVETGIAALEAGKTESAVANLSSGIGSGRLPSGQMARALYYRGVAYRKQSKPALAIADLTSALWLRGGLTGSLRKEALENRAAAYREAGLPDQTGAADTAHANAQAPASADKEAAPASRVETGALTPATAESTKSTTTVTSSGGSIGGIDNFFSSLFGANAPAPAPAAAAPPPPPAVATSSWRTATEVQHPTPAKAWADTTTASTTSTASAGSTVPSRPAASASNTPSPATGRYRLQVASVRSQAEAQALAARVREKHGADIGALQTEIDATVVGNMGTLYRVRLGPFADADGPRSLCAKLKGDGLDCLVVDQ